jgi:predicted nucleic acid-binding protein
MHRATIIPVDDPLIWTHAHLRASCRRVGHPLHDNVPAADLWIAASALATACPS